MSDHPGDRRDSADGSTSRPRELTTPLDWATYVASAVGALDELKAHRGADERYLLIDRIVATSLNHHGVEFLRELVDQTDRFDPIQLGLADAVKPDGRLWQFRDAFNDLTGSQLSALGMDSLTLNWHHSRDTALRGIAAYTSREFVDRIVADKISRYGVPEWSLGDASSEDRALMLDSVDRIVHDYQVRGIAAPLVGIYGVGVLLEREASAILSTRDVGDLELEVSVARWHNIGAAYQKSIARHSSLPAELANGWIRIVKLQAELGFDSSPKPRFRALPADLESETGLRLWQALDAAVLSGSATVDMTSEWADVVAEMRIVDGRPELSSHDFAIAIGSRRGVTASLLEVRPHLASDGHATRDQYQYACRVMSSLASALADSASSDLSVGQHGAIFDAIESFRRLKPPLLSPFLSRQGSRVLGRLIASWDPSLRSGTTEVSKEK